MTAPSPSYSLVAEPTSEGTIVRLLGTDIHLDEQRTENFRQRLFDLLDHSAPPQLLLDFRNVRFLSSTTLGVLVSLYKRLQAKGGRLVVANLNPEVYEVFQITRLERVFEVRKVDATAAALDTLPEIP
jgi:anti-sigma B factor antagonist